MTLLILCHFFPFFLAYLPQTITLPNHRETIFFCCVFFIPFFFCIYFPNADEVSPRVHTHGVSFFLGGKNTTIYSSKDIYMKIHYMRL